MTKKKLTIAAMLAMAVMCMDLSVPQKNEDQLERDFQSLPIEARYHTGPLFWLHGDESRARLEEELTKVLEAGNGTFTAESRPHNDWLGEGWYRDLAVCLEFARAHRMQMYIFDEKWWPSGEVAGKVPQEYGSKVLVGESKIIEGARQVELDGCGDRLVAVIAGQVKEDGVDGDSLIDLTPKVQNGKLVWDPPKGRWSVMKFTWAYGSKKAGRILVDGASKDAVDWYLKTVYQPHYDHFRDDFGKTIQGFFYDEPETHGDWGTEVIPMLKSRGVDWKKALVAWKFKLSGEEQVAAKYQYQDARAEAWGQTLFGGISDWCRAHGVISIGHFLEHEWEYLDEGRSAGNMFQLQKYSSMGGIDLVFKQILPGQRPMGIYQTPKLASSISHVYGKQDDLAMVEIFGARGQDLTYPEMKWDADLMQVSGVNFLIPHSFNPRAPYDLDCPPFFYNGGFEPRYPLFRVFADYSSRLNLMLTGGRHVAQVAFLFLGNSAHVGKFIPPEVMTTALQDALFDCDWMPYDVFESDAKLEGKVVRLSNESYEILIVPPVEVIPYGTLERAKAFFDAGGVVVGYGFLPEKSATIGRTSKDIAALTSAIWGQGAKPGGGAKKISAAGGRSYLLSRKPSVQEIQKALSGDAGIHPDFEVLAGRTDNWLHVLHRVKNGRDVFFITNQNLVGGARPFKFRIKAAGEPEAWDPMRNEITAVAYQRTGKDQVEVSLALEPSESILLVFQAEKRPLPMRLNPDAEVNRQFPILVDPSVKEPPAREIKVEHTWSWKKPVPMLTLSPARANPFNGKVEVSDDLDLAKSQVYLVCEDIAPEAAARVTLNGMYAGGFIGRPLRLNVSKYLVHGPNVIRIEPFAPGRVNLVVFQE